MTINLLDAFDLTDARSRKVAITGAGGKTSVLFRLARAYQVPVLVSNTAHLAVEQGRLADHVIQVSGTDELPEFRGGLPEGVTLVTGSADARGRTQGLEGDVIERLRLLASDWQTPLLIEADGSRGLPLKAPAAWEPPIPDFADLVIVCAGMTGLGKPLTAACVYRAEDYSRLSGIAPGEPISLEGAARVLLDHQGGLKNIPESAARIALLNQADTPELRAAAEELARNLLSEYEGVVIASLHGGDALGPAPEVHAVYRPVAGIILAAGGAQRMGQPKQLLDWMGEPLVRRAAKAALEAGLDPVIVVTGAYHHQVERALSSLNLRVVNNPAWEEGQSTSVKAGLAALARRVGAAIFLLADQPFANADVIRQLTKRHAETLAGVIAPMVKSQRANPVLFDRRTFIDLLALTGDSGGRQVLGKWGLEPLEWNDDRLLLDIDDQEGYLRALAKNQ